MSKSMLGDFAEVEIEWLMTATPNNIIVATNLPQLATLNIRRSLHVNRVDWHSSGYSQRKIHTLDTSVICDKIAAVGEAKCRLLAHFHRIGSWQKSVCS